MFRCFNPLPARRPGATQNRNEDDYLDEVSILSQPEGRELLDCLDLLGMILQFQSSPSPKAGSYLALQTIYFLISSFNPLPARRPGATRALGYKYVEVTVSILSQPEGRELHERPSATSSGLSVSILSQPEGRELHDLLRNHVQFFNVSILSQPEGRELHVYRDWHVVFL